MKNLKKLVALLAIFLLIFPIFGNAYANLENKNVDRKSFLKMIKNKEISKKGLNYIVKKRLNSSDFAYLKTIRGKKSSELKKDEKVLKIVNKLLGNGLGTVDVSYMETQGYFSGNNGGASSNNRDFLSPIGNKTFKVNFRDITAENAGKVIKTWEGKENFPEKFVLRNNFSLDLKEKDLDKLFKKSNKLKADFNKFKAEGLDLGKIEFKDPVLKVLPDRIQIEKKTEIKFNSKTQLNNIKSNLNISLTDKEELDENGLNLEERINNLKTLKNEALNKKYSKAYKKELQKINLGLEKKNIDLEKSMLEGFMKECSTKWGYREQLRMKKINLKCSDKEKIKKYINTASKTLVRTETQEISLLPPNTVIGNTNSMKLRAGEIRLTKSQIEDVFEKYKELLKSQQPTHKETPNIKTEENPERSIFNKNYCKKISGIDENLSIENINNNNNISKEIKDKFNKCLDLLEKKDKAGEMVYKKNLLNGFTLGESHSYEWSDSIYISFFGLGKKKLAEAGIRFWYSYGFGIRVPIQAEVKIDKHIVDDSKEKQSYKIYTKAKTIDAGPDYYREVGLEKDKIFGGKEFVFEMGAGVGFKLRLIGDLIDIDEDIGLISLLASYCKASGKSFFGLEGDELDKVIKENGINKSKNFIPPFDGDNNILLFDNLRIDIPIYELPKVFILGIGLGVDVKLNGKIKAKLELVNSKDCRTSEGEICPEYIKLKKGFTQLNANAVYNPEEFYNDALGKYSNFGVNLEKFRYIPELVFEIFLQGLLSVNIPIRGRETFSTPKIVVYTFSMSSDDIYLSTHKGTSGKLEAFEKNMVYTNNPKVDLQTPKIEIKGDDDSATFEILNNKSAYIKNYYTINGAKPTCDKIGKIYNGKTRIWSKIHSNDSKEPYNDLVKTKDFNIQVVSCSIIDNKDERKNFKDSAKKEASKEINLKNKAFDFKFTEKDYYPGDSNYEITKIASNLIDIIPQKNDYKDYLKYNYTMDSTNPSCSYGEKYKHKKFSFEKYAKTQLKNDLNIEVRGISCNKNNGSFNEIVKQTYKVHNTYFDPKIRNLSYDYKGGLSGISYYSIDGNYYDKKGYSTYIIYAPTVNKFNGASAEGSLSCEDLRKKLYFSPSNIKIYYKKLKGANIKKENSLNNKYKMRDDIEIDKELEDISKKSDKFYDVIAYPVATGSKVYDDISFIVEAKTCIFDSNKKLVFSSDKIVNLILLKRELTSRMKDLLDGGNLKDIKEKLKELNIDINEINNDSLINPGNPGFNHNFNGTNFNNDFNGGNFNH